MDEPQTIERSYIDHIRKVGGDELLAQLTDLFFKLIPERIQGAQAALEANDLDTVCYELHKLRSGASNFGTTKLNNTSITIEQQARQGESAGLDSMLEVLEFQYQQARDELRQILEETANSRADS